MNLLTLFAVMICMGPIYIAIIFTICKWNGYERAICKCFKGYNQREKIEDIVRNIITDAQMQPYLDRAISQCSWLVKYIDELYARANK